MRTDRELEGRTGFESLYLPPKAKASGERLEPSDLSGYPRET